MEEVKPRLWYCNEFLASADAERSSEQVQISVWKKTESTQGTFYEFNIYSLSRLRVV